MEEYEMLVRGGKIHYLSAGKEGSPLILYIHGNLACGLWFSQVMQVRGHRTVAPDLPNFGHSYASGDYSIAGYAAVLEEFVETLNLPVSNSSLIVVGHSFGGVVAMELAARGHLSMEKLILVSPGPIDGLKTPRERYPIIKAYRKDRGLLKDIMARVVLPTLKDDKRLEELVDAGMTMHYDAFIEHPRELAKADFRQRLGILDYPVLILRGDMDTLINQDMCEKTAAHIGADLIVLPKVGHSPMVENPGQFMKALVEFLER